MSSRPPFIDRFLRRSRKDARRRLVFARRFFSAETRARTALFAVGFVLIALLLQTASACRKPSVEFLRSNEAREYYLDPKEIDASPRRFSLDEANEGEKNLLPFVLIKTDQSGNFREQINGEYYKSWPKLFSLPILPSTDRAPLKGRFFTGKPLEGIEVFLDAGLFSDRPKIQIQVGREKLDEKELYLEIAKMSAYALESLGASVTILASDEIKEVKEYARIYSAASKLLREARDSSAVAEREDLKKLITEYLSRCNTLVLKNSDEGNPNPASSPRGMAQGLGASEDERVCLDLMAMMQHAVYIQLKWMKSEEDTQRGYAVSYLDNAGARRFDEDSAHYYAALDPNEYSPQDPSYQSYPDADRRALALALDAAMKKYCPKLHPGYSKASDSIDEKSAAPTVRVSDFRAARHLSIPVVRLKLGLADQADDLKLLLDRNEHYYISKAICMSVYEYFCGLKEDE